MSTLDNAWRVVGVVGSCASCASWVGVAAGLLGCAATSSSGSRSASRSTASVALVAGSSEESCDVARDREAIAGMAGVFEVSFEFEETEALAPGYTLHEPYRTSATEVVVVLEEGERMLRLQHVLVFPSEEGAPSTMKHWRQDWVFEDRELLEFRGHRVWAHRELPADEARCTWSQAVYEVDDGPRYESFGRFVHTDDAATWTSHTTWRPLPRREYTQRSDYDVLVGENRHVVKADGWQHEQDNVKVVTGREHEPDRELVRERGINRYARTRDAEAERAAAAYLESTNAFWSAVRDAWSSVLGAHDELVVSAEVDGKPLYEWLFPLADALSEKGGGTTRARRESEDAARNFIERSVRAR